MGLEESRARLKEALLRKGNADELVPFVEQWFSDFKVWEKSDTFDTAYSESRMTIRIAKSASTKGSKYEINQGTFDKKTHTYTETGRVTGPFVDLTLKGIASRMTPSKFYGAAARGQKYELGLMELPASLLNGRRRTIAPQAYPVTDPCLAVFTPVPKKEDAAMFYTLNELVKSVRTLTLWDVMRQIKSKMTRIKLAQASDMHTGIIKLDKGDGRTHLRYGYTGTVSVARAPVAAVPPVPATATAVAAATTVSSSAPPPPAGGPPPVAGQTDQRDATPADLEKRFENAVKYENILRGTGYNEIVLVHRENASPAFPVFVEWPGNKIMRDQCTAVPKFAEDPRYEFFVVDVNESRTGARVTNGGRYIAG